MSWLGLRDLPIQSALTPSSDTMLAVAAWNLAGGLEWSALETVCEVLGIADVELLIYQLVAMREHMRAGD